MNTKMPSTARSLFRETGIAFAVLALYVLTLLLPLHLAAAQQRDLNAIGYSTLDSWSICQPLAQDEQGEPHEAAALNCPAMGIAKHQFATPGPAPLTMALLTDVEPVAYPAIAGANQPLLPDHIGQSRAPPVPV